MDGYSDWEYYSDDYYDDDPGLLRDNPQEGSPSQRSKAKRFSGVHRGKKRKLAATSDIPEISLDLDSQDEVRTTRPWFEGTVWKATPLEKSERKLYEPGMGERVALLGDWREMFNGSQPFGKSRGKSPSRSRRSGDRNMGRRIRSPSLETSLPQNLNFNGSSEGLELDEKEVAGSRDRKRRRMSSGKGPNPPPNHNIVVGIPARRVNGVGTNRQEPQKETVPNLPSCRKRKAKVDEDESSSERTLRPRAKRVASGRVPSKTKLEAKPPPLPTTRTTRSKKK